MAYNYYQPMQPMGYAQMYQNMYSQTQPQIQQMQTQGAAPSIIWVDNYNDALIYPIAPNAAVALWDKSAPCVYIKKADATGKPAVQIFDLVERKDEQAQQTRVSMPEFATKTDLRAVSDAVEVLRQGFEEMRLKIENRANKEDIQK